MGKVIQVVLWVLVAFAAMAVYSTFQEPSQKQKDRDAIKFCWDGQAKKSNAPQDARTIAKICETLEEEFTAKYGSKP